MTLRDKVKELEPHRISGCEKGGVQGCPEFYSYLGISKAECLVRCSIFHADCDKCWSQELEASAQSETVDVYAQWLEQEINKCYIGDNYGLIKHTVLSKCLEMYKETRD